MKNIRVILLVIAGLLLAALLALRLADRAGGRRGRAAVPVPAAALPPGPEPAPAKPARARVLPVPERLREKRRKPRVSPLRDPGEAMGGGVRLDLPDKTTGQPRKN